jgi:hypothetical protein
MIALLLAQTGMPYAEPAQRKVYIDGIVIEIRKGDDIRYLPHTFQSERDCVETAPVLEKHSAFQGWSARCVQFKGNIILPKTQ